MKKRLVLIPLLLSLIGCGGSNSSLSESSLQEISTSSNEISSLTSSLKEETSSTPVSSSSLSSSESSLSSIDSSEESFEDISLPGFDDSSSIIETGAHKLSFTLPDTMTYTVYKYASTINEEGDETPTLGEAVDLNENLLRGEYFVYFYDTPGDEAYTFIDSYGFEEGDMKFIYYQTNLFFFNWLDTKDVTIDMSKYVSNASQTGDEAYLGSYTVYQLNSSFITAHEVIINDDSFIFDGNEEYLDKASDTSFSIGIFGNGKYTDGFIYFYLGDLATSTTNMYIGYKSGHNFSINTLWENVYNSSSYIMEVSIDGEKEIFYNRSGEIHTTFASLEVEYENTSLGDSTYIYLSDYTNKFDLNGSYYAKVKYYIQDENASSPRDDRHYFNFKQGGKEAGRYTLKGNPDGDVLTLDGFNVCTLGEKSGTYSTTIMSTQNGYVYKVTVSIIGEDTKKFILDQENKTYEVDTLLNSDPFVVSTTYVDPAKRYLRAVFNNSKVNLTDLSPNGVSFSVANYTVRNSNLSFTADYEYDYYNTGSISFTFKISIENDQYVLTLLYDAVLYDEMIMSETVLYAAGMKLIVE